MEQMLQRYGLPPSKRKSVTVIMLLFKNAKALIHSPEGRQTSSTFAAGVLQEDIH